MKLDFCDVSFFVISNDWGRLDGRALGKLPHHFGPSASGSMCW